MYTALKTGHLQASNTQTNTNTQAYWSDELATVHYWLANAIQLAGLCSTTEPKHTFIGITID